MDHPAVLGTMGGFTRDAEEEARRQEKLPEVQRRLLPIRPIYF
jgi:hypothetical protein